MSSKASMNSDRVRGNRPAATILDPRWVADAVSGRLVGSSFTSEEFTGVSTDTRSVRPGELFVALVGERFDGHEFVREALKKGAAGVLVNRSDLADRIVEESCGSPAVILVEDTDRALVELASSWHDQSRARTVAITGSNGKTSTKHLLGHCCRGVGPTVASPKSFNNCIGVPLTLLRRKAETGFCVVEVGTNAPGEVAALARVIRPEIGILTQIGPAHLEGLGSIRGVMEEKRGLLTSLPEEGFALINGDDSLCREAALGLRARVRTFGLATGVDYRATEVFPTAEGTSFVLNGRWRVDLPFPGSFHVLNALAALGASDLLGFDLGAMSKRLGLASVPSMRFQVLKIDGITVFDDAYNANPGSLSTALGELSRLASAERGKLSGRRIAVLGTMRELGTRSAEYHRAVGRKAAECVDDLIAVGAHASDYLEGARRGGLSSSNFAAAENREGAKRLLLNRVKVGDFVLIKASRSEELDRLVGEIRSEIRGEVQSQKGRALGLSAG